MNLTIVLNFSQLQISLKYDVFVLYHLWPLHAMGFFANVLFTISSYYMYRVPTVEHVEMNSDQNYSVFPRKHNRNYNRNHNKNRE